MIGPVPHVMLHDTGTAVHIMGGKRSNKILHTKFVTKKEMNKCMAEI